MINATSIYAPAFEPFVAYWASMQEARISTRSAGQQGRPVPLRCDFNPMRIPAQLPQTYIVERYSHDHVIIRLCGTGLEERFGRSMTGANYFDFCSVAQKSIFANLVKSAVTYPCGLETCRDVEMGDGTVHEFKSVSFPLADDEGVPRFLVGMMNILRKSSLDLQSIVENPRATISGYHYLDIGFGLPVYQEIDGVNSSDA